jgi:GrpB-like predicted nucleotidyltransferase (UPF0157 family)
MVRKIIAVPNNPQWSSFFRQEAEKLASILGAEAVSIHHIGSTAIPDIHAKPIVDILIEVADIKKVDSFNRAMIRQGYQPQGEFGIPGRRFFIKGGDANRTCHIHIFEAKNPEICRHLRFRDYMIAHPKDAQAYSRLKQALAQQCPEDIKSYMAGKDAFIKEIDKKAKAWRESQA